MVIYLVIRTFAVTYSAPPSPFFRAAIVSAALSIPTFAASGPLLSNGDVVVAKFSSGTLKGKTFRLKYNESKNVLKDRPVTDHSASLLSIKTPGGWCNFEATGRAECHNGVGTWKKR
ncbi:hypothetical protein [uncultured Tateyamaria sp.]|uniref:hypothetical protein n=1 Tax=uncultured Tateyamaria sp. TaxID=455651 RepID=UPI0026117632|nr:hypothetical protein [uncultured Tateyamaria sp.]